MELSSSEKILSLHKLRKTNVRLAILDVLIDANEALSKKIFEDQIEEDFDRVTLYRTIKTFEDKGIIHGVPDLDGNVRYALCKSECDDHHHHDAHVHFQCAKCGKTKCLEDTPVPNFQVNEPNYQIESVQVVARGLCEKCQ